MNMGHHGLFGKGNATTPVNMYDTSVKVPAIFRLPVGSAPGAVRDEMVSHYDLYPTILALAGIDEPLPDDLPGVSFLPCSRARTNGREKASLSAMNTVPAA